MLNERFAYKCKKCHQICPVDKGLQCFNCKNNSNTGPGMYESFHPEQPEMAVRRATGVESASRNHLDPINMPLDSMILVQNGKRNKPNDQIVKNIIQANTQSNQEMYKITDGNSDYMQATNTSRIGITSCYSHSDNIREAFLRNESQWNIGRLQGPQKDNAPVNTDFLNNESEWNICHYQGSQKGDAPVNEASYNNEYQWNIGQFQGSQKDKAPVNEASYNNEYQWNIGQFQGSQKDKAQNDTVIVSSVHSHNRKRSASNYRKTSESNTDKRTKPKISTESSKNISNDSAQDENKDDTLESNATLQIAVDNIAFASNDDQNIESSNNISETNEDFDAPSKISYSIASNTESVFSVYDSLAMPGPFGLPESKKDSNLFGQTFQSFTCMVCKVAIAKHATEKNTFKCCNCSHTDFEEVGLQIHSFSHLPETTCSICEKKHAAGNSHNSEHRCLDPDCKLTFYCRTELYKHFLVHIDYLLKQCWFCGRKFKEHKETEKVPSYICCVCGKDYNRQENFKKHYRLHLPKFYCKLCKEEYSEEEKSLHGTLSEFTCFECPEEFKCQTQVEAHYEEKHNYWCKNCRICKRSINEHLIGSAAEKIFQCCKKDCLQKFIGKFNLQDHLYSHTRIRDFKCETCGRRFKQQNGLNGHFNHCIELPFKCELCEIRFHSSDILRKHFLAKHKQP